MNERKYWVFRVHSTPDAIVGRLTDFVTTNGLRERIPYFCLEKFVRKRGQHEFFVFLSIAGEEPDQIPQEIREGLSYVGINHLYVDSPLTYDQIKPIASLEASLESVSYARRIDYSPPEVIRPDNPFDLVTASEPDETPREAYNRLLYWMSATGKGTWQAFREACGALKLSTYTEARIIFRRLRLLGHVEHLDNGSHWAICPSSLVRVSDERYLRYFLAGAQVPVLVNEILAFDGIEVENWGNRGGSDSVFITFNSLFDVQRVVSTLQQTYNHFRDVGTASARLADALPDLNGWYHEVLSPIGVASDRYWLTQWNGEDFETSVAQATSAGMYRLKSLDDKTPELCYYYYFDPERHQWFQGDWYGLRFLANWRLGIQAQLNYDPTLEQLFVPDDNHLPDLYERALVLASGKLPSAVYSGLVYDNVTVSLAETICSKLYAELIKGI
jgi:hypothetical protein